MKWGHSIQYSIHLVTKLQWLHLYNCWTTQRWHAASNAKLHVTNILQVIGLETNKQTHLGGSEYLSLSPWRRIIILWFKLSYGVAHSAAMQKLHSTHSSVGHEQGCHKQLYFWVHSLPVIWGRCFNRFLSGGKYMLCWSAACAARQIQHCPELTKLQL